MRRTVEPSEHQPARATRRRRSAPRPSQIQRALRRSRWRTALTWAGERVPALALAGMSFGGAIALGLLPDFRVQHVTVRRQTPSADEAMTRATQLARVVGHNIFLVNSQQVAEEIASIPSVLRARVIARLPNTVEIEIVERKPIATWQTAAGSYLVDDQGYLLAEAPTPDPANLSVRDTTGRALSPGDRVDQRTLLAARELAKALPSTGVRVREVEVGTTGLVFISETGWRIIFGEILETKGLNDKLANLASVADAAQKNNWKIAVLDLRPKDRPFYQLAP
jgi:cell division septal protein FtsQ